MACRSVCQLDLGGSVDDIPIGDGGFDRRAVDSRSVLCGVARVHL